MQIQLWTVELSLAKSLTASSQVHQSRPHLFLRLEDQGHIGWGEVSPNSKSILGDPGQAEIVRYLVEVFIPMLNTKKLWQQNWSNVGQINSGQSISRWSASLCEMALLSLQLAKDSQDLNSIWPEFNVVQEQRAQSLLDGLAPTIEPVRVKVTHEAISYKSTEFGVLTGPVIIDFNAAGNSIEDVVSDVQKVLSHCDLVAVEQPFAPGNLIDHAHLAERIDIDVSLDESVRSITDLRLIAAHRAAQRICVKVSRVGGLSQAISVIRRANDLGLNPYVGGFFESEIARSFSRALCRHLIKSPSDVGSVSFAQSDKMYERTETSVGLNFDNIVNKVLEAEWTV